ncbi:LytTR family DNA-binding domain-containing protein [Cognatiyoonia sp. IB215182]|uniref:LytTR family DNA-binding domain-containing protein n=1 Tax=Cognatiyoonia sp. IB215182 TaxID=3097353 RepID=UPI002A0AFB40|nr:LytTR family DNA-binding domain-containing protein [Cognatiyoonia sp. IB215182]MDX8355497.1 LytTR family DNA-binding domain-containing protein [Cognatiyoonia sp. IB215182]
MRFVANDTVLGETLVEARALARNRLLWAGLAGGGFLIGLTGPFGTYSTMQTPMRLAYWALVVMSCYWIGLLISFAAATWLESLNTPPALSVGLGALVASVPITLWLSALHAIFLRDPFWADFSRLLPYVAVISLVLNFLVEGASAGDTSVERPAPPTSRPAWLDRLPPEMGSELLLLQAQDHYLRAQTPMGETLIRGSISEASDALGDYGIRVHRSWWVARWAICTYRTREGGRIIILSSGEEVPVGRSYWRSVKDLVDRT